MLKYKPTTKPIQIHPRALPREKECGDCEHFVHNLDPQKKIGWCKLNEEATTNYDECSAFSAVKE